MWDLHLPTFVSYFLRLSFLILKATMSKRCTSPLLTVHPVNGRFRQRSSLSMEGKKKPKKQITWWRAQAPRRGPRYKMWLGDSPLSEDDEWASAEVSTSRPVRGIGDLKGRSGCVVMWCSQGVFIKRHHILMGSSGKFDSVGAWNRNGTEKGGRRGVPLLPDGKTDFKEEMGTERVFRTDLAQLASNQFWGI